MNIQTVALENFLKVEIVTFSKVIAKQLGILHFPNLAESSRLDIIGWIARDAIERDSRECYLCRYTTPDGAARLVLVPVGHIQPKRDANVPQIFVK